MFNYIKRTKENLGPSVGLSVTKQFREHIKNISNATPTPPRVRSEDTSLGQAMAALDPNLPPVLNWGKSKGGVSLGQPIKAPNLNQIKSAVPKNRRLT